MRVATGNDNLIPYSSYFSNLDREVIVVAIPGVCYLSSVLRCITMAPNMTITQRNNNNLSEDSERDLSGLLLGRCFKSESGITA